MAAAVDALVDRDALGGGPPHAGSKGQATSRHGAPLAAGIAPAAIHERPRPGQATFAKSVPPLTLTSSMPGSRRMSTMPDGTSRGAPRGPELGESIHAAAEVRPEDRAPAGQRAEGSIARAGGDDLPWHGVA